jgi:tRNA U34 5-methylaminomethyl-2-thiouridine-forming methyltransferase MnmC
MHVFIEEGLRAWRSVHPQASRAVVFEMGLGSGLNALLAWREAHRLPLPLLYRAVERYPVGPEVWERLNYGDRLAEGRPEAAQALRRLHTAPWEEAVSLDEGFTLVKHRGGLADYAFEAASLDVVFFDAFAPDKQPDLWSSVVFRRLGAALRPGGVLTTYSAKGVVRRRLEAAGLRVEKRVGPPGKREMLRAWRPGAD